MLDIRFQIVRTEIFISQRIRQVSRRSLGMAIAVLLSGTSAIAGGGGQNMLLVVDPSQEHSLRIANAYAQLRGIPDRNIVFVESRRSGGFLPANARLDQGYLERHIDPVYDYLQNSGLEGQIDYIATLGQPTRVDYDHPLYQASGSFTYSRLDALSEGDSVGNRVPLGALLSQDSPLFEYNPGSYQIGTNQAETHAATGWYMSGAVGYTGLYGNSPDQIISLLQRTVAADGTKPQGTIYFEENDDIRSNSREPQWDYVQSELTARGIAWQENSDTTGAAPLNKSDVRGAIIGAETFETPNGSTYLPGSWADNFTSTSGNFNQSNQTKITELIAAGVGGTSGSVAEPFAYTSRHVHSNVHLYVADGSTLGEAAGKSVENPFFQLFVGDMLSQAYADVPTVQLTGTIGDGSEVNGVVEIAASANVTPSATTTGVAELQLFVDGKYHQTVAGDKANFELDTTTLSDGVHEVRVVALNDSQAASQGYRTLQVKVNNDGRSSSIVNGNQSVETDGYVGITVQAEAGSGQIVGTELRHLGRTIGQRGVGNGNITLRTDLLAYGENRVVPVTVFDDGTEVFGEAVTITREKPWIAGQAVTNINQRQNGIKAEFFYGKGASSIAESNFTGPADLETLVGQLYLNVTGNTRLSDHALTPEALPQEAVENLDGLAVRLSGRFEVSEEDAGEYSFFVSEVDGPRQLIVDGHTLLTLGNTQGFTTTGGRSVFLEAGEHEFELLASHYVGSGTASEQFDLTTWMRGPNDAVTRFLDDDFIFQVVPEPSMGTLCAIGLLAIIGRGRRR